MSRNINSFAVLDDSDDEQVSSPPVVAKNETKKSVSKPTSSSNNVSKGNSSGGNKSRNRNTNNDRNTKGGRGPRTARDGKRTYDRRSGTGRGKEIKKGGGGARNWGSDKNDAKKAEGHVEEGELNKNAEEGVGGEATAEETATPPAEVVEEEEDKTLTLDEYLSAKKDVTLFQSKGEKVVENEFEGKSALDYVEENFLVMGTGKSLRKKGSGKKGPEKIEVDFRFKKEGGGSDDRPRRGGGRGSGERRNDRRGGDRRGGRRGGGRGGGRGFALDSNAFPSL